MGKYMYKILKFEDQELKEHEKQINKITKNGWEVDSFNKQNNYYIYLMKKSRGFSAKEYLKQWETPFLNNCKENRFPFKVYVGAKYLNKNIIDIDTQNYTNLIINNDKINYYRNQFMWKNSIIFTMESELKRLIDCDYLDYPQHILINKYGFIEFSGQYHVSENDKRIDKKFYNHLSGVIKLSKEILKTNSYDYKLFIMIQFEDKNNILIYPKENKKLYKKT